MGGREAECELLDGVSWDLRVRDRQREGGSVIVACALRSARASAAFMVVLIGLSA